LNFEIIASGRYKIDHLRAYLVLNFSFWWWYFNKKIYS